MPWVKHIDGLHDFISYVVVHAPDEFPQEDFLDDDEQMTLDQAFAELRDGLRFVEAAFPGADKERGLSDLLDRSLQNYKNGDDIRGAHLLQEFERRIFKGH